MMTFGETTIVPRYRTTSVTAQLGAALGGRALAVLPIYMASSFPTLSPILSDRIKIELTYWMSVHNDLARSTRVRAVMDGIEQLVRADREIFAPAA
jgi:DNA-binding transcriptional LysR family regulator